MGLPTSSGFVLLLFFFFSQAEPLWILQKLQPSCSWFLESSHPPIFPSKTRQKPKRTRGAREVLHTEGRAPVMPGRAPAASTKGANTPPWSLSAPVNSFQGGILEVPSPSQNCDTEFRLSSRETHVPLWSCGPPCGFQISLCEKSDWTTLPAHALFEIDEKSVSNSQFLPWAPLSPRGLFCHSLIKELSKGFRVQAALRRSSCLFLRIKDS